MSIWIRPLKKSKSLTLGDEFTQGMLESQLPEP
jgi:hypothetical protein